MKKCAVFWFVLKYKLLILFTLRAIKIKKLASSIVMRSKKNTQKQNEYINQN